jgi:hypothetical protein
MPSVAVSFRSPLTAPFVLSPGDEKVTVPVRPVQAMGDGDADELGPTRMAEVIVMGKRISAAVPTRNLRGICMPLLPSVVFDALGHE